MAHSWCCEVEWLLVNALRITSAWVHFNCMHWHEKYVKALDKIYTPSQTEASYSR